MSKPDLDPEEHELATWRANHSQGSRAVGGHLLLTDRRVVFYPHKLDRATGGRGWECDLESVSRVGMSARGVNPFNGSLRKRLQIESRGAKESFVVNGGPAIANAIERAIRK